MKAPSLPPRDGPDESVDDSTIGGGCAAEALVNLGAYPDIATAIAELDRLGEKELAHRRKIDPSYSNEEHKVYKKGERWCSDVVTKAFHKKGLTLKKLKVGKLESQPSGRTLRSLYGGKSLFVDGTKNQDYLVAGKRKIDDKEDPPPAQDPALWRHLAIVKEGKLYDAYYPNGLSLKRCDLYGINGYFKEIFKCYDVQQVAGQSAAAPASAAITTFRPVRQTRFVAHGSRRFVAVADEEEKAVSEES